MAIKKSSESLYLKKWKWTDVKNIYYVYEVLYLY